ncbi:MAG: hypothetical protein L0L69_10360 [Propionibacterium sp.]|nr:hypothetical protein [Propionibacterium sp.]
MKKVLGRIGAVLLVVVVAVAAWAWVSPWPSVLLIRQLWPEATAEQA